MRAVCVGIALVMTAWMASAAAAQSARIQFPSGVSESTKRLLIRANVQLMKQCPSLSRNWPDIESATVEIGPSYGFRAETFGWGTELWYKLKVKEDLKMIPPQSRAWGHTLHFYLGAGKRPGIVIQKQESQSVCGVRPNPDGSDKFLPVADLAFVDQIPSK